jgi:hypothetical protein
MSPGVVLAMAHASGGGVFEGRDGMGGIVWDEVVGLKTPRRELLAFEEGAEQGGDRRRRGLNGDMTGTVPLKRSDGRWLKVQARWISKFVDGLQPNLWSNYLRAPFDQVIRRHLINSTGTFDRQETLCFA